MSAFLMSEGTTQTLILSLLGAGGTTFVWTIVKSYIAFRNNAEGREARAVGRLEKYESECREQLAREREWGSFWYRRAGLLEHTLAAHGIETPPGGASPQGGGAQ